MVHGSNPVNVVIPFFFSFPFCRHSHGGPDQVFSNTSIALARICCLTIEVFVDVVMKSYTPNHSMTLLKRTLNFHEWLEGSFAKYHCSISLPRQFVFSKEHDAGSTSDGVQAMVRCSEWSNSVLGPPMFPLQRLPISKPRWNANRSVFSKWETINTRTTPEKSEEIFKKAEAQIFRKSGDFYDIPFDFQRDSWKKLLKQIRKWEKLQPEDYQGWWPICHEEVSTWVSNLAKLPPTLEGKFIIC